MNSLSKWQQEIGDWAREAFPQATERTILSHLRNEVNTELFPGCDADELADVVLLVLHLANMRGIDLEAEIEAKHEINTGRTWAAVKNAEGFYPHVEPEPDELPAFKWIDADNPSLMWTCPRCRQVYKSKRSDHPGYCPVCMIGDRTNAV